MLTGWFDSVNNILNSIPDLIKMFRILGSFWRDRMVPETRFQSAQI